MKRCLLLGLAIILLASGVGVSGCKGAPEKENSFLEMLKLVPDTPDTRFSVYINDYAMIRESYDIPLPPSDADDEAIEEYIVMLASDPSAGRRLGGTSFVSGMGPPMFALHSPIRRHNIGFGPQDVDQDILAGPPPITFEAIKGRYDTSVIKQAVNRYESEMPRFEQYEGIAVIDWGYGGNELVLGKALAPPAFDNLGRCRPLGVGDRYIFRAFDTNSIKAMIDASQGQLTSLADNPDFSLMATALSEMGAHSVFLTDQTLGAYQTLATGLGKDEEGVFMTVVLVYDSLEEASSDVPVFEQRIEKGTSMWTARPWQDLIDSWEVWADGRTLQARLRGEIVQSWLDVYYQRDTLLQRGE